MKSSHIGVMAGMFAVIAGLFSCSKSNESPTATVKFSTATASYGEDGGTVSLSVELSAKQSQDVVVSYTWASPDTSALLGGDFTFATPTPITIPAGQTTGAISVNIIDDTQIDGTDSIHLTLSSVVSGAAAISTTNKTLHMAITDNDVNTNSATNLQVDLTWFTTLTANITAVQMDIVLAKNVVYDTAANTLNFDSYSDTGGDAAGFRTLNIPNTITDDVYYILVIYSTGTLTANYKIVLNGWGYAGLSDQFKLDGVDTLIPYGAFTKSGTTFDFTGRVANAGNSLKNFKLLRLPSTKKKSI